MPALSVSRANNELEKARTALTNFRERHKSEIKKAAEGAKTVGAAMIAGGTAYGLSYAMSRLDDAEVAGVPYDLGAAVVAVGAGLFVDNDAAKFALNAIGTGALCNYASRKGQEHGTSARLTDAKDALKP